MLLRGDSYTEISAYLDGQGADKELKKQIFTELEELDKRRKEAENSKVKRYNVSMPAIIIGSAFFVLTCYLQKTGIIKFPLTLIGAALGGVAVMHIIRAVMNLFKRN
jgi:hypothetical protein